MGGESQALVFNNQSESSINIKQNENQNAITASMAVKFIGSKELLRNAAMLNIGSNTLIIKNSIIYKEYNYLTGEGVIVGNITPEGELFLTKTFTSEAPNVIVLKSFVKKMGDNWTTEVTLRTPSVPIRPASFYIEALDLNNNLISATADVDGNLSSPKLKGKINVQNGIAKVRFGEYVSPKANYVNEPWYSEENVVGDSVWKPIIVKSDTIKYNAVAYTYLPLDAKFIGLDATRLPQDGRVPIFKKGYIAVIHNSQEKIETSLVANQQINLGRADISAVDLYDANGTYIPNTNYSVNLATGIVTMANPLNLSAYTAPFKFVHRIEDMVLLSDVQINGTLYTVAPIKHSYPAYNANDPTKQSYVSSVLKFGDIKARVYNYFHQQTWTSVWSNDRIGNDTTAKYNFYNYPILITNKGAITERWAVIVISSGGTPSTTKFKVVGEKMGYVADASQNTEWFMNQDCSPINPATNTPYFTIRAAGWGGAGFSVNNVLRFNTDGGCRPIEFIRTTLQGPPTENNDCFRLQIRGDAD